MKDDLRKK
jgi:hypothetical protein